MDEREVMSTEHNSVMEEQRHNADESRKTLQRQIDALKAEVEVLSTRHV
eukprot:CAMPEP_0180518248 /NCGR_PEP_ID=MMETSP1036_2-20121128/54989_1 /TAXON_ID=632150 /ORGANISM="Azadinium spinosum, Strain 3D9" /LENGTH=48 /DNA_ID= /DNA_START= /DNA_END= /DNA_ORIENTATION=